MNFDVISIAKYRFIAESRGVQNVIPNATYVYIGSKYSFVQEYNLKSLSDINIEIISTVEDDLNFINMV